MLFTTIAMLRYAIWLISTGVVPSPAEFQAITNSVVLYTNLSDADTIAKAQSFINAHVEFISVLMDNNLDGHLKHDANYWRIVNELGNIAAEQAAQ